MRKNINRENIEGRIYQHNLEIKTVQNTESANYGKEFISGTLEVAVDEDILNVIPVHFTYTTETTSNGNKNQTFSVLKKIIEEDKTILSVGKDNATKVRINTSLGLNDFYNNNDELVSAKVNEGGFVTIISELRPEGERNTFTLDMVITGATRVVADPDKNIDKDYVSVKGVVFNFRNDILPVDLKVDTEDGMSYFEGLEASDKEPVYTQVWGKINCSTKVNEVQVDSAFGEPAVKSYDRKVREWIITGAKRAPYDFGDETVLTMDELKKASQDRATRLAEVKKRSDDYKAQKASSTPVKSATTTTVATGTFNF